MDKRQMWTRFRGMREDSVEEAGLGWVEVCCGRPLTTGDLDQTSWSSLNLQDNSSADDQTID